MVYNFIILLLTFKKILNKSTVFAGLLPLLDLFDNQPSNLNPKFFCFFFLFSIRIYSPDF